MSGSSFLRPVCGVLVRGLRPLTVASGLVAMAAAAGLVGWVVAWIAARWVPLPENLFAEGSQVVAFRDGTVAHVFLSPDEKWRIPVRLEDVDEAYVEALLFIEDRRFFRHSGVDLAAAVRAAMSNLVAGKVVSGASTITMQLVRVREPRPRTLRSKAVEAFRALQIEARFDKRTILEAYLQYIPFGRNLEGVEAAALAYFGHRADALSAAEIATLLAVPQSPSARWPTPSNMARLTAAQQAIAARLSAAGLGRGTSGSSAQRRGEPSEGLAAASPSGPDSHRGEWTVPSRLRPMPRQAPHAARWLFARHGQSDQRLVTSLDPGIQRLGERLLLRRAPELRRLGIQNAAVVIVEHGSRAVRGLIGNFDFWDAEHGGQIVGFDTPRSPGSALKPILYAMAIDRGELLPDHAVSDTPRTYGAYSPRNYDGQFHGFVRAEEGLSMSLNVPFVEILARIGADRFVESLRMAGVLSLADEPGHYGLSAAIGGLEVTPLEIAGLYATLAAGGVRQPLRFVTTEGAEASRAGLAAFSPGAAYLTRKALRLKDRPDFPARRRFTRAPRDIHWKTGTSYGHRDAWAVGSNARHTVAVWLGNFDNRPSVHLTGADAAGPVLFDLLEALESPQDGSDEDLPTRDLREVEVCALSGRTPTQACPHRRRALALAHRVPTGACRWHREVEVDVASGLALTPSCRAGRTVRRESFVVYPAAIRRHLRDVRLRPPRLPSLAPGCSSPSRDQAPAIVEPPQGHEAYLMAGMPADRQEIPLVADTEGSQVRWFVNGEFLGVFAADERAWWTPRPGCHDVVVVDDAGRSAKRTLLVHLGLH